MLTHSANQTLSENEIDYHLSLPPTLAMHIENSVRQYFSDLGSQKVTDVYDLMLQQFERPLLTAIFELTKGNQTHMAEILGLNRGTLRKKLKRYDFIE